MNLCQSMWKLTFIIVWETCRCKRKDLCRSLAGNVVDLLEISENVHTEASATVCMCLWMCVCACAEPTSKTVVLSRYSSLSLSLSLSLARSLVLSLSMLLSLSRSLLLAVSLSLPPQKAKILLSARVHPGETQGSWAIQSCIEFLTSRLPEAKLLRSRFTIYVVPMLNPDGDAVGVYERGKHAHTQYVYLHSECTSMYHIHYLVL